MPSPERGIPTPAVRRTRRLEGRMAMMADESIATSEAIQINRNTVTRVFWRCGLVLILGLLWLQPADAAAATYCGKRYVASGDFIPAGRDIGQMDRYPERLLSDHLQNYGYCVYNIASDGATSSSIISGGQLATTWNRSPNLITLSVGEQNSGIVKMIDSCFDKIKDHDFSGASVCASEVLANSSAWSGLTSNLTTTLQQYRMIMSGRPSLVVAILNYPNPYPSAASTTINIPLLCVPLLDTAPTCSIRWAQLPVALGLLDQAVQKLNTTIQNAAQPFINSSSRFVYVDIYSKFQNHCMKMDVSIKTTVEHPEEDGVIHEHDSSKDFGCSSPWFVEGDTGTEIPTYLDPAALGVLTNESQTTTGMGVSVNADGQKCIADAIWEADTIDPGLTPLKWKLGVPEAPNSNICQ